MRNARLVERCLEGDSVAWEEFTKRYGRLLEYAARVRLEKNGIHASGHLLEEIVQQILVHLWEGKRLAQIRDQKRIHSWLAAVAGNVAMDYWRSQSNRIVQRSSVSLSDPINLTGESEENFLEATLVAEGPDPREESVLRERQQILQNALTQLSTKEQLILREWIFLGQTYQEISQMLGISQGTVAAIIHRAKAKLRRLLEEKI